MSKAKAKRFQVLGKLKLANVNFTVNASSADEARTKAANGEWDDYEVTTAEAVDWELDPDTVEEDKFCP